MVATVTGSFLKPDNSALNGASILFTAVPTNFSDAGSTKRTANTYSATTDSSGAFSISLNQGDYLVTVQGTNDSLAITVPSGGGSLSLNNLLTSIT